MITLISALNNIILNPTNIIRKVTKSGTRINIIGDSLEDYIKNAFAGTFLQNSRNIRVHNQIYSWQGNQNNPPDLIIKGYDAIEVKKIEGTGSIALNSSYPHSTIRSDSKMITADCSKCEPSKNYWEKDVLYAIGTVKDNIIKYLFFVYGDIFAAKSEIYERIQLKIKEGILDIPDVEFTDTNELGKVKKVDPLGITDLRIRGMWAIQHPFKVYSYIPQIQIPYENGYHIFALLSEDKFCTYDKKDVTFDLPPIVVPPI
jgi:hypothetical protein